MARGWRAPQNHPPITKSPSSTLPFPISPAPLCGRRMLGKRCVCRSRTCHTASPSRAGPCSPSPGWALPAGLGAPAETDGAEPLHVTLAPWPGSAKGQGCHPAGCGEGKGPPAHPPPLGTAKPAPVSAAFPFSSSPFGFWQRSRGGGWGTQCRGRAAKRRQPPAVPGPPCQDWWLAEGLPVPGRAPAAAGGSLCRACCQFPCELAPQAAPEAPAEKAVEDGL